MGISRRINITVPEEDWKELKDIAQNLTLLPNKVTRTTIMCRALKEIIKEYRQCGEIFRNTEP